LAQRDQQLSQANDKIAELEAALARSNAAALAASAAAAAAASSRSPSKDTSALVAKLEKKLEARDRENDELVEELEQLTARAQVLEQLSTAKSHALTVMAQLMEARVAEQRSAASATSPAAANKAAAASAAAEEREKVLQAQVAQLQRELSAATHAAQQHPHSPRSAAMEEQLEFATAGLSLSGSSSARSANEKSRTDTADAELRRLQTQLRAQNERVAALQSELDEAHASVKEEREKASKAHKRTEQMQAASDARAAAETRRAEERIHAAERAVEERVANEARKSAERASAAERRAAEAEAAHSDALADADALRARVSALESVQSSAAFTAQSAMDDLRAEQAALQEANSSLRREIEEMEGKLADSNSKVKELITANERRVEAASAAATVAAASAVAAEAAAAASPRSRNTRSPLQHDDDDSSSGEDSRAAVRRRRKLSALSPTSPQSAAAPASSPSSAAALASAQQELLSFKQLLADKNHVIEELEGALERAKQRVEVLDQERSDLLAKLEAVPPAVSPRATAAADQQRNAQLFQDSLLLNKRLEGLTRDYAAAQRELSSLRGERERAQGLQERLVAVESSLASAEELHALKLQQERADGQSRIHILQKFKTALTERYKLLEQECAALRARGVAFASLTDSLDKRYTDSSASARKKLDHKELSLLTSLQESQRRCEFLQKQLAQGDAALAELKDHYETSHEQLEQELAGLERENDDLKELYKELQQAVRLGSGLASGAPAAAAANGADLNNTGASSASTATAASGVTAALSIEWARYESLKLRLGAAETANDELHLQVEQLQAAQSVRLEQLDTARRLLDEAKRDQKLLKDELVRSGLALKALADDNYEMKEFIRLAGARK